VEGVLESPEPAPASFFTPEHLCHGQLPWKPFFGPDAEAILFDESLERLAGFVTKHTLSQAVQLFGNPSHQVVLTPCGSKSVMAAMRDLLHTYSSTCLLIHRIYHCHWCRQRIPSNDTSTLFLPSDGNYPMMVTYQMEHSHLMEQKGTLEHEQMRRKRILYS
jgi:hypothetical protein